MRRSPNVKSLNGDLLEKEKDGYIGYLNPSNRPDVSQTTTERNTHFVNNKGMTPK